MDGVAMLMCHVSPLIDSEDSSGMRKNVTSVFIGFVSGRGRVKMDRERAAFLVDLLFVG